MSSYDGFVGFFFFFKQKTAYEIRLSLVGSEMCIRDSSRTGMRRAQTMKYSTKNIVEDKKSGEYRLSHHLDLKTGMYKGRQVLDPKE